MRVLIIADIHGNKEALRAVLGKERKKYDCVLCLGDVCGYGPDSEHCIRMLKRIQTLYAVAGNHDAAVTGQLDTDWFNRAARNSVYRTRQLLSPASIHWLEELPRELVLSREIELPREALAVHGSPSDPLTEYLWGEAETAAAFVELERRNIRICFAAHTHEASVFTYRPGRSGMDCLYPVQGQEIRTDDSDMFIICNPGSVGFPRSFNGERTKDMSGTTVPISERSYPAYYAVWDTEKQTLVYDAARYNRRVTEDKIDNIM